MNDKKKPVHEVKFRGIKAAVFAHENNGRTTYSTKKTRSYRIAEDKRGEGDNGWRETEYMGTEDLPIENEINSQVVAWVCQQEAAARQKQTA